MAVHNRNCRHMILLDNMPDQSPCYFTCPLCFQISMELQKELNKRVRVWFFVNDENSIKKELYELNSNRNPCLTLIC